MMEHLDMNRHEPAKLEVNQLKLEETGPHLKMEDFQKREDQSWDCSQEEENAKQSECISRLISTQSGTSLLIKTYAYDSTSGMDI